MARSDTLIGTVQNVSGNKVSVMLNNEINSLSTVPVINGQVYRVGQIGSFLKIPLGYVYLFGIVTQVGADAVPEKLRDEKPLGKRWLTLVLFGECIGNTFERGVSQHPTVDDQVHLVTKDDLAIIYGNVNDDNCVTVGHISVSESLHAWLDLNKLVTRHSAILGTTGSGKSNAVTVLLSSIARGGKFPSARILLIDPHGEYGSALSQYGRVFRINADSSKGEHPLYVPFWALPFKEIVRSFAGSLTDIQEEYLREKILEKRMEGRKHISSPPDESAMSADSPIPFSIKNLWYELDRFERTTFIKDKGVIQGEALEKEGDPEKLISAKFQPHSTNNTNPFLNMQQKGILRYLTSVRNRLSDQRYQFLFSPGPWEPDLSGKVDKDLDFLLKEWLAHDKSITILDLSGVPPEIMSIVSGAVIKIVYDALFWGQYLPIGGRQQPLLMILEEAHIYLQAGEDSVASRVVRTIAKEGRKYGVGLGLVTQRPSELDTTVLSQCGTSIVLRMSNGQDRSHVAASIQDDLSDIMSLVPSLRTGEALVIGEAVRIPSRIRFDMATKTPRSADPEVTKAWSKPRPDPAKYSEIISLWRKGRFN